MGKQRISAEEITQVRAAMALQFPNCFAPKGAPKKPLKIGIIKDLTKEARIAFPGLTLRLIRGFIRDYTSGFNYQKCMVAGASRVGLDGSPSVEVTAAEAVFHARKCDLINSRKRPTVDGKAVKLTGLRQRLAVLIEEQQRCTISNGRYFTDGSKAIDDRDIHAVQTQIRELEAA